MCFSEGGGSAWPKGRGPRSPDSPGPRKWLIRPSSKEKFPQKPCYFGCYAYFVVSRGPLEGPLGFFFIYVSIVHILLPNISQNRLIPRFLDASSHLYKRVRPSVRPSVRDPYLKNPTYPSPITHQPPLIIFRCVLASL